MVSGLLCACGRPMSDGAKVCKECRMGANRTIPRVCEQCGVTFLRRAHSRDSGRFCSKLCGGIAKRKPKPAPRVRVSRLVVRHCAQCSQAFSVYVSDQQACCSIACKNAHNRGRTLTRRNEYQKACDTCKCVFVTCQQRVKTCFPCKEKRNRRIAKGRRKARMRGVLYESVDPFVVFGRDGWRCQLCGCATPRRLRGRHMPASPELDHIVPISCGGAHTYANTQCACRQCNGDKGGKTLGQLRLAV